MKTLHVYIDETGSFAKGTSRNSFVGGFAINGKDSGPFLEEFLTYSNDLFLNDPSEKMQALASTKDSSDFWHSMELSIITRNNLSLFEKNPNDKSVNQSTPPIKNKDFYNISPEFAEGILSYFNDELFSKKQAIAFYAKGAKQMYTSPQDYYLYQLKACLYHFCDYATKHQYKKVHFFIASRDAIVFDGGVTTRTDKKEVKKEYISSIKEGLQNRFLALEANVSIDFADRNQYLKMADLTLGVIKYRGYQLKLSIKINPRIYLQAEFPSLATSLINALEFYNNDEEAPSEILYLFELMKLENFNKISSDVISSLKNLSNDKIAFLDEMMYQYVFEFESNYRYTQMEVYERIARYLLDIFSEVGGFYKSAKFAHKILFSLRIHKGLIAEDSSWADYNQFLNNNHAVLFNTPFEYFYDRANERLTYVQLLFNGLQFDAAIATLLDEITAWQNAVKPLIDMLPKSATPFKDDYLAKAYGTIGQALLFKGYIENNPKHLEEGVIFLEKDLKYLDENSRVYKQGLNFLITAKILACEFDSALNLFTKLDGIKVRLKQEINVLTDKGSLYYNDGLEKQKFDYLNQLRFLGLKKIKKQALELSSENLLKQIEYFMGRSESIPYPDFFILKWLLFLADEFISEDLKSRLKNVVAAYKTETPLLNLLFVPVQYLVDRKVAANALKTIQQARVSEGFNNFFEKKKDIIERIYNQSVNNEEVMLLLPYYYS